jgi:hypothetical protein
MCVTLWKIHNITPRVLSQNKSTSKNTKFRTPQVPFAFLPHEQLLTSQSFITMRDRSIFSVSRGKIGTACSVASICLKNSMISVQAKQKIELVLISVQAKQKIELVLKSSDESSAPVTEGKRICSVK